MLTLVLNGTELVETDRRKNQWTKMTRFRVQDRAYQLGDGDLAAEGKASQTTSSGRRSQQGTSLGLSFPSELLNGHTRNHLGRNHEKASVPFFSVPGEHSFKNLPFPVARFELLGDKKQRIRGANISVLADFLVAK